MQIRQAIAITGMLMGVLLGAATTGRADDAAEVAAIKTLMAGMFDQPQSRLDVGPVVVVGDHAIAGWSQGDMGGRALLRRKEQVWQLILCSGDPLKSAEALAKMSVPAAIASRLAAQLAEAEAKVSPERLAMFARFDGIVMMDSSGHHPPMEHGAGQHPPAQHQGH